MRRIICIAVFLSLLFVSCRHNGCNQSVIADEDTLQNVQQASFILHPDICEAIKEISSNYVAYIGTMPIFEIYFTDKQDTVFWYGGRKEQDTVVYLSAFREQPDDWFNAGEAIYRGLLSIDSLPVAIYERNRCGANLYDSSKLVYVPLHNLKKLPKHTVIMIYRWGVQGDSLIPDILP